MVVLVPVLANMTHFILSFDLAVKGLFLIILLLFNKNRTDIKKMPRVLHW